jgi:transcriptional regulator with XRE-family HTH domain
VDAITEAEALSFARRAVRAGLARPLRIEAGLSQAEVGRVCGVTHAAVSRWESGDRLPRGDAGITFGLLLRRLQGMAA